VQILLEEMRAVDDETKKKWACRELKLLVSRAASLQDWWLGMR